MSYPPSWRVSDPGAALAIMREHPFAHIFTAHGGLNATRAPFIADIENGRPAKLRAHLNRQNPQADKLDGAEVLIVFSGYSTYVSPHWRTEATRGGTYDYEEVRIRGKASVVGDISFFRSLIDDLSALIEPQYAEAGEYPVWRTSMAPEGYVERLHPAVTAFEIRVHSVKMISKLHQQFPEEDRRSIAEHLERANREGAQEIAKKIRRSLA